MKTHVFPGSPPPPASGFRFVTPAQVVRIAALLAILGLLAGLPAAPADLFVKVDQPGWTNTTQYSTAAAWGDYDGDGFQDLVVANAGLGGGSWSNFVYRNQGDGTLRRQLASEVGPVASDKDVTGAFWWGDINNDGALDLVALNTLWNQGDSPVSSRLYVNQGQGTFTSAQAGALTARQHAWGASSWCDYDNDGYLDAFLSTAIANTGRRTNMLLHGRGDLTMEVATQGPLATNTIRSLGGLAWSNDSVWSDFDGDGDMDLFVSNAQSANDFAYRNEGHGRFSRMTNSILESLDHRSVHQAWGDFDNDGDLDVIQEGLTATGTFPIRILRNEGEAVFLPQTNLPPQGPAGWADIDNDGYLDIVLGAGAGGRRGLYFNRSDGTFVAAEDAFTRSATDGPTFALGDYDNDGFLDLFGPTATGDNALFRNQGNGNHWIKFQLTGTAANRSALGAKVRVKATVGGRAMWQMREVIAPAVSGNDLRPNFGLGDARVAEEVRVEWPSGNVTILTNLPVDQIVRVTEVANITPARPAATINGSVTLAGRASGISRQWFFEGLPLEGQTGSSLLLTNLQPSQEGRYTVVVQTDAGPLTNHVYLRVLPQFTKVLEGAPVTDEEESIGTTWIDYDTDGHLDLFVATTSIVPDTAGHLTRTDTLYHNRGDGTFERITGDPLVSTRGASWFGAPADIDNDGDPDMLTNWDARSSGGLDELFLNDGKGHFSLVPGQPFGAGYSETTACAWADFDLDGDLDLFASRGWQSSQRDALYWNQGSGTFTAADADRGGPLLTNRLVSIAVVCFDYDEDGAQDLLVVHGQIGSHLHRNNRDGTFSRLPPSTFSTPTGDSMASAADYDNDGKIDLYIAAYGSSQTTLYRHLADGTFANVTAAAGIRPPPRESWAVGTWADYDNDGFLDLFIASYAPNSLYRNRGDGTFESVDVGNIRTDGSRRVVGSWGDYDNNGFPDLYVTCGDAEPCHNQLYRNNGNGNHWLKIKLVGTTSNRDGLGAKVRATASLSGRTVTQLRELSGYATWGAVGDRLAHFGLGDATKATKVRIEWPSGTVQELSNLAADQLHTITEPALIRLAVTRVADGIRLEWRGEPNTVFTLQSLEGPTWRWAQAVTTDAAGVASATLPTDGTSRFLRVLKR